MYIITKSSWGGAQKYVYELAKEQIKSSYVTVLAGKNELGTDAIFKNKLEEAGISLISLKNLGKKIKLTRELQILKQLVETLRVEQPEVIHLNSSKIGGLGALAGRIVGIPKIVFTIHGLPLFEDRNIISKILITIITYITILLSHEVITINKREYEFLSRWPLVKHKLHLIYNAVGTIPFFSQEDARKKLLESMWLEKKRYALAPQTIWIMSIGELVGNKGYAYLLKALTKLSQSHDFVFVHFGTGELEAQMKKLTKDLGLENRVAWFGFDSEASRYLHAADIFIQPSVKEGLSYVLLEAAQAGLPVIATRVGGTPEIVLEKEAGILVEPKKPALLHEALIELLDNQELRAKYSQNLHKHYKRVFSIKTMRRETFAIYK